ncbi:Hsp20/alpha crystallin family protein [Salinithrix halophila]|uniref:Hsp20/alpha crystallin family protein n=1 Tax=Salinithrix halophila TaxID=1485204 RepID=A0ABV8JIA8_9BACL
MLRPWFSTLDGGGLGELMKRMEAWSQEFEGNRIRGDFYQKDGEVVVMLEIPGLKSRHEIDVRVEGQILTVRGTTEAEPEGEIPGELSAFVYEMLLPGQVDVSRMVTRLHPADRVLTVRLPRV